jgi:hypothetical protein
VVTLRRTACVVAVALGGWWPSASAAEQASSLGPVLVSMWYRGSPAGTPRREDLEAIRAAGFSGVTWPARETQGQTDLFRMAGDVGLQVTLRIAAVPATVLSHVPATDAVDVHVGRVAPEVIGALVWRAAARGARVVSFDSGAPTGTGFVDRSGRRAEWVLAAQAVALQLARHARLLAAWRPAGAVRLASGTPDGVDVTLLGDARSWILVVTNTTGRHVRAAADLPPGVPSALWVDLLDGSMMSMINEVTGPRWSFELPPGAARVYAVNRGSHLAS